MSDLGKAKEKMLGRTTSRQDLRNWRDVIERDATKDMLKSVVDMQDELKNDALARDAKRRVKSARHQLEKPVADRKKARGDISELQGEEAFLNQRLRDLQVKNEGLPGEEAYLNRWIGTLQHETHRLQAEEASSSQKIADLQHQTREWAQTATILKQERQSQKGRKNIQRYTDEMARLMTRPREGRNMKEENRDRQIPTPTLKRAKRMVFDKEGREWHLK